MKINAISYYKNNFISKSKQDAPLNYNQPSFEGIFDSFKKQPAQKNNEESDNINQILKSAILGDKALKSQGKHFLKTLNKLLKYGKEDDYKGHLTVSSMGKGSSTITFGDIDEELKVPTNVNIWQNGKIKTVYNIESISPQSIFTVSTYDDDKECFFRFINDKNLCFQCIHNDGTIIAQFPSENGFIQQVSEKIGNFGALLNYEIYWDYKNPNNSHVLYNSETDAIKYGYNKQNKTWYQKEIIPEERKDEIETYTIEI